MFNNRVLLFFRITTQQNLRVPAELLSSQKYPQATSFSH
ncbi:hypothetical protein Geob_2216 [Geotalea daltonii FRC-32]|uniref:Uncharacterized protein n=1 Tax=Geotalea daltonii (strain DSM 22248 / JCM 15807 / FRC-32) TaxID=316067 RepID=B9M9J8_GEODF|nr:hypothetical protein Geob_2216 [Geotalea daltonii FRC-32]